MYDVRTDHKIVAFDSELMRLFNCADGTVIVTATRADGSWTVHADGVDDVTAADRPTAITAMTEQALAALPGAGYSTTVPYGLADLP
ncbi:hypothetical protein [Mycolicibacterium llatzerense]|uniref:Uncharacterized protein n=1 Tax=Mycolicibacterium llatzerense TaxID=280871 RepID=A0A0D1LC14_9MYCO|nr:hypothetical protein [Mycolicibacterium llatzerense]KIU18330.1 hypothetical protein TL10_02460 [Mycolicibacterium llatzerense]